MLQLSRAHADTQAEATQLRSTVAALEERTRSFSTDRERLRTELEGASSRVDELELRLAAESKARDGAEQMVLRKSEEFAHAMGDLTQSLEAFKAKAAAYRAKRNELRERLRAADAELARLRGDDGFEHVFAPPSSSDALSEMSTSSQQPQRLQSRDGTGAGCADAHDDGGAGIRHSARAAAMDSSAASSVSQTGTTTTTADAVAPSGRQRACSSLGHSDSQGTVRRG